MTSSSEFADWKMVQGVNIAHTVCFKDMTEEESRPLLDYLYAHCARPEFTWRHRWQPGDVLIWDNASWHTSGRVRAWIKAHNRRVKREGGVRLVVCYLPSKSPWLNRIEPKWVHGKRAIAEPDRKLHVDELKHRICAYYDCELLEPIAQ